MTQNPLEISFLLMMLFQIFHIFEEVGCGAHNIAGGLKKYLIVASTLVTLNFTAFGLILYDNKWGYILGIFTSLVLAVGNGVIHSIGWIKTRTNRDSLGAGVFTGIPLALLGVWVFFQILPNLN